MRTARIPHITVCPQWGGNISASSARQTVTRWRINTTDSHKQTLVSGVIIHLLKGSNHRVNWEVYMCNCVSYKLHVCTKPVGRMMSLPVNAMQMSHSTITETFCRQSKSRLHCRSCHQDLRPKAKQLIYGHKNSNLVSSVSIKPTDELASNF